MIAVNLVLTEHELATLVESLICYVGEQKKLIKFAQFHGLEEAILAPRYRAIKNANHILRAVNKEGVTHE